MNRASIKNRYLIIEKMVGKKLILFILSSVQIRATHRTALWYVYLSGGTMGSAILKIRQVDTKKWFRYMLSVTSLFIRSMEGIPTPNDTA